MVIRGIPTHSEGILVGHEVADSQVVCSTRFRRILESSRSSTGWRSSGACDMLGTYHTCGWVLRCQATRLSS